MHRLYAIFRIFASDMAKTYQSFSRRLSRRLILIVLIMMGLMVVGMVTGTLFVTEEVSEAHYQVVMETSKKSIEKELRSVEVASLNDAVEVERHLSSPEDVFETLERNLRQNTGVRAYFAAFEPGFFAGEGHWFCAHVYWDGKNIVKQRIGSQQQDYLQRQWYKKGIMDKNGFWSEPYIGVSDSTLRLCSFIVPIHDQAGRPAGVFGADIDLFHLHHWLKWKDESMNRRGITKIGRESRNEKDLWSYSFIVSREGDFFSHPDSSRIFNDNLFRQFGVQPDTVGQRMIRDMKAGNPGIAKTKVDGTMVKIFYAPLEHTDWMVGVVVPQWVQLAVGIRMSLVLGTIVLIGLLLIYVTSRLTIQHTVKPLHAFAQSAEEVAKGNFSSPLPDVKNIDELRMLHDAFGAMQTSLSAYVEEVKSTTAEKAVFESEMSTAALIQMHMIPNQFPPYPERSDIDIYGMMEPAKSVGGDLFDFLIRDNRLFFCIGDVSGKGVPAALVMAVTRSLFHSISMSEEKPERIVWRLNRAISDGNTYNMFVTLFVGILDLATGRLDYCNAGHETPLLSGQPLPIIRNKPVGALPDWRFEGQETRLQPGDTLFLYTDGVSEAKNQARKMFGRAHVAELVESLTYHSPQQLVEEMVQEVYRHAKGTEQSDDITILAITWKPQQSEAPSSPQPDAPTVLTLSPSMDEIDRLKPFITETATQAGLASKEVKRLRAAVEEAVANVINYSGATALTLQAEQADGQFIVTIDDDGSPFDPTQGSATDLSIPPDQRPPGGMGLHMIQRMTDRQSYQRSEGHNILKLFKNI